MYVESAVKEGVLNTSTTVAGGFVTITIPAKEGMRGAVVSVDWQTDLAPSAAIPVEYRGGAAGTTQKWGLTNPGTSGFREYVHPMAISDPGIASDVRVPATTTARLSVRYCYVI